MPWLIILLVVAAVLVWWWKDRNSLTRSERNYLKRRGYYVDERPEGEPVSPDKRMFGLVDSLHDVSPSSRQRAAEEISQMCDAGMRDQRLFAPLVTALDDNDPGVRGAVVLALASLADDRAARRLRRVADEDDSIHVRATARRALERLNSQCSFTPDGDHPANTATESS